MGQDKRKILEAPFYLFLYEKLHSKAVSPEPTPEKVD